jgi:hypothetical protein
MDITLIDHGSYCDIAAAPHAGGEMWRALRAVWPAHLPAHVQCHADSNTVAVRWCDVAAVAAALIARNLTVEYAGSESV